MENKETALLIVNDILGEIQDGISARPKGEGISPDNYIEMQLMSLADLLNGYPVDSNLAILKQKRNKLNREISTLKKVSLKQ